MTVSLSVPLLHVLATLAAVGGLCLALRDRGDWDFALPVRVASVVIAYMAYWIIFLAMT